MLGEAVDQCKRCRAGRRVIMPRCRTTTMALIE